MQRGLGIQRKWNTINRSIMYHNPYQKHTLLDQRAAQLAYEAALRLCTRRDKTNQRIGYTVRLRLVC